MSTYVYLICKSHEPPLRADAESGQHLYDLPDIRRDLANRSALVTAYNLDRHGAADWSFHGNTVEFLVKHPLCSIGIRDEYGEEHPIAAEVETR